MSDNYFQGVGYQSERYDIPHSHLNYTGDHSEPWVPRDSIPWSLELSRALVTFFNKCDYPFRTILGIPFEDPLRSEIRRFFLSLDAYIDSPHPVIPYRELLYGSTQKDYAKYLKRVKRKSFETTWYVEHFAFPDWWNDVPAYQINDIGDIFNYSYLIHFKDEVDDYLEGFIPVKIDQQRLNHFKQVLKELLPSRTEFNAIDGKELISTISSSISIERNTFKHIPHYKIKGKYLSFSEERHISERCVIQVSPENCRDTVLNDPGDLNTITLIDQQVMEILRVMPGHIHLRDKELVTKRYKKLYKKNTYFLQRDLKKEGITKPRELLKAMLEVLNELYPDVEAFRYKSFFDNFVLRHNEEFLYPTRGHGLGMANSLTTLMQLVVHEMILDVLQDDIPTMTSSMLAINDDFVAGFQSEEHLEAYWDMESEILESLSLIREPTKSFYSRERFVLAERYFVPQGEYAKTSYQLRELLLPLACANITHAKDYFISAQTYVNSKFVGKYLGDIIAYWGYEFYPTEFNYPYLVGGWINEKVNSVDMSLVLLDELDLKSYVYRGYNASKQRIYKKKKGKIYHPPFFFIYSYPNIPEEYRERFDLLPYSLIDDKYGRVLSRSNKKFLSYWNRLYRLRQKAFKEPADFTYESLVSQIISDHPTTQFYPSDIMIKQYHPCNIMRLKIDDIYLDPNPKLALISYYNDTGYNFKERFSIEFSSIDSSTKKTSSLFSKEIQRTLKSEIVSSLMTGRFNEIYVPKDDYHPEEQYLNPVKIAEVTAILNWGKGFPEIFEEYRSPIIEKKREVFNRIFSLQEQSRLTQLKLNRDCIKMIAQYLNDTGKSFNETLDYIVENYVSKELEYSEPTDDDFDEGDPTHITDEVRGTFEPINKKYKVTMNDLIENGSPIVYTYRTNQDDFIVDDPKVKLILGKLGAWITVLTHPILRTPEYVEEIRNLIRTKAFGDELSYVAYLSGVVKLLEEDFFYEDTNPAEGFDALFGEG